MPWKSLAQAAYMHIHHPEVAKEFDKKSEHAPGELPEHVGDKPKLTSKRRSPKPKR